MSGCKYTVYNGIPHAYAEGIIKEPTCIEKGIAGSATDCVCGVNEVVTYTIYTAEGSEEKTTEQRELPLSEYHVLGTELANIKYKNGYLNFGTKLYYCALCHEATVEEKNPSAEAIFEDWGYSLCTYGKTPKIVQGYGINKAAENEYRTVCPVLEFGVVICANQGGEAVSPLKLENGNVVKNGNNIITNSFNSLVTDCFDIRLSFGSEASKENVIIFCAYVYDGAKLCYIENKEMVTEVTGNTYNNILNSFVQ
ncbi:MAG: hypothetical protein E7596_07700 [Ruminococcaceae bacterium]|nr:hypothetical protein [Oscillospiraceae bacterium]